MARFRLSELLEEYEISQSELARQAGVAFQTINRLACNRTERVDLETLQKIADALGIEPGDLIEGD